MIDIHSHILMNVDDGAKTAEDSIAMAKQAIAEGIHTIVATPHHMNGTYKNPKEKIMTDVVQLNELFQKENIPLTVLAGQEIRLYGELLQDFQNGEILSLNNGNEYLLIELPSSHVPMYTECLLHEIQLEGLIPVIVHPERNKAFLEQPDRLYHLVNQGALTQVTAASIAGCFGKSIQKFSHQLIEANLTHVIASDAHNTTTRGFKMTEAMDVIEKKFGYDTLRAVQENADLLVQGQMVYKEVPQPIKKSFFHFLSKNKLFLKSK